jgi:hypothetical protein
MTHTGNVSSTGTALGTATSPLARGVYTFDTNFKRWNADNASSNYRMQLSMRYSF